MYLLNKKSRKLLLISLFFLYAGSMHTWQWKNAFFFSSPSLFPQKMIYNHLIFKKKVGFENCFFWHIYVAKLYFFGVNRFEYYILLLLLLQSVNPCP